MIERHDSKAVSAKPEWPLVRLDEVASRGSGHTPSKKRPEYWNGSIPWISLADTARLDKGLVKSTENTITAEGVAHSAAVVHPAGTVILLRGSSVGKSAILASDMTVSQDYVTWTCGPRVDNWYLYYVLQSRKAEFARIGFGNTIKTIGLDYFRHVTIPLPLVPEQREIAKLFGSFDALIFALEQLIAKKQAIKQGMMERLLTGRTRLRWFNGEWQAKKIGELLVPRMERHFGSEALEVLSCTKHEGFVRSLDYFKNQVFSKNLSGYKVICRGDIGYPANHVEEGSIGVQESYEAALVSPIYVVMRPLPAVDTYFLQRQLKLDRFRQEFARTTNASVNRRGSLRWPQFSQIAVLVPEYDEQRAISRCLRDSEAEVQSLQRRLAKAQAMKHGTMQQLLTGRTRLPI